LLTSDTLFDLPENLQTVVDTDSACWLGVPLNSQNGTIGAIVLRSHSGDACYTEKDKELLQFVSSQVATAIERKQLHTQLRHSAQYDELTHLPNRGLFFDRLETALTRARRNNGRLALLYLDLDNFKDINDSFGHAAGDVLLQKVATLLKRCLRKVDTIGRVGGDEFVVLLENIELQEHALMLGDKIRRALDLSINIGAHRVRVRLSIGISFYPEHGDGVQQLLKYADDAMYLEKKNKHKDSHSNGAVKKQLH